MLTVQFDRLPIGPGTMFLDAGAGFGRHAFEAARRGAHVVALDYAQEEVVVTRATFAAMFSLISPASNIAANVARVTTTSSCA